MRCSTVSALAVYIVATAAFKNTSPYLFLSTAELHTTQDCAANNQLQTSAEVLELTKKYLASCPTDAYVIVSQPGLNAADLKRSTSIPHLRKAMFDDHRLRYKHSISEVLGGLQLADLQDFIIGSCNTELFTVDPTRVIELPSQKSLVVRVDFASLPSKLSRREIILVENDYIFHTVIDALPSRNYTILYTATPGSEDFVHDTPSYEPDFIEPLHMELRRQSARDATPSDGDTRDKRPLFEKYQFFTPGLFMALFVSFILLSILGVGVKALSSLQVSYGAFDKEMGPAAQKKQQ